MGEASLDISTAGCSYVAAIGDTGEELAYATATEGAINTYAEVGAENPYESTLLESEYLEPIKFTKSNAEEENPYLEPIPQRNQNESAYVDVELPTESQMQNFHQSQRFNQTLPRIPGDTSHLPGDNGTMKG